MNGICYFCIQGIYVLQDNSFRWLLRLSPATTIPEAYRSDYITNVAQPYLELPCGIIRGKQNSSKETAQRVAPALAAAS